MHSVPAGAGKLLSKHPEESESEVTQSCPTLCDPMDYSLCQAFPSMGFSRQKYWSGLPFPSPGDLPDPGWNPRSPALHADTLPSEPPGKLSEDLSCQFPTSPEHRVPELHPERLSRGVKVSSCSGM